jgi:hypothetical protein
VYRRGVLRIYRLYRDTARPIHPDTIFRFCLEKQHVRPYRGAIQRGVFKPPLLCIGLVLFLKDDTPIQQYTALAARRPLRPAAEPASHA